MKVRPAPPPLRGRRLVQVRGAPSTRFASAEHQDSRGVFSRRFQESFLCQNKIPSIPRLCGSIGSPGAVQYPVLWHNGGCSLDVLGTTEHQDSRGVFPRVPQRFPNDTGGVAGGRYPDVVHWRSLTKVTDDGQYPVTDEGLVHSNR